MAAGEAQALRLRAAQLAAQNQCTEALPLVQRARQLEPEDARAALLEGKCLFQEKRYEEAAPAAA